MREGGISSFRIFTNPGGLGNTVIQSVAKGLNSNTELLDANNIPDIKDGEVSIVWGILRGSDQVIKQSAEKGTDWYHIDHAYVERGHDKNNYRLTNRFINGTQIREVDDKRGEIFEYELKRWTKGGGHILVCPPSDAIKKFMGVYSWLEDTLNQLKKYTDREIRIRDKKNALQSGKTLTEDLNDCHAVVTHLSNIAVDAVLMGVPVFVNNLSAAWHVSSGDLKNIEKPIYPDRELWINNLLYQQFRINEFETGEVWKIRDKWLEGNIITRKLES